jgi:hypothetical protein
MGFAIPFNGTNPITFIQRLDQYKDYIDYIYISNNHIFYDNKRTTSYLLNKEDYVRYMKHCKTFLEACSDYKIFLDISQIFVPESSRFLRDKVISFLKPEFDTYPNLTGVIVSDYELTELIHQLMPDIEIIQASNLNLRAMYTYEKTLNITDFILPKDSLRNYDYIQYLKKIRKNYKNNAYNFKYQAIVNNSCYYGCPTADHVSKQCMRILSDVYCFHPDPNDFMRRNWVLPRWLHLYDDIIDTYIIEGLYEYDQDKLFSILDAYINRRDDIYLQDIIRVPLRYHKIPVSCIHNKLNHCMCMECDVICNSCKQKITDILSGNIEPSTK